MENQAGEVVPPRLESKEKVLGAQDHPGQGLVDAEVKAGPVPAELGPAQTPVGGVFEEVRFVIPVDEVILQAGEESDHDQEDEQ